MRDHGGNIDWAIAEFGGTRTGWIDLSTGINRVPYPIPDLTPEGWAALPTKVAIKSLSDAAADAYRTNAAILPLAGAQAAIQMIPRLGKPGHAKVLSPTYNEHAASLKAAGWTVEEVQAPNDLAGADMAVLVNPNNPDGREMQPADLLALFQSVGQLVVDESFADARPDLSIAGMVGTQRGLYVLRSFGKFYGLAGLRLGFVLGHPLDIADLSEMAGPWPISGPAVQIGRTALSDQPWAARTIKRLIGETTRIDALANTAGWQLVGGTELFRLYDTPNAVAAQNHLANTHIWTRSFPWSPTYLRLGLPGDEAEWARLETALREGPDGIR
ncbi:threonine-phosphate decarboxylase CobD [Actibacterium lipolyticum]|uniref:threonine-phosphate decarboxylase n=1 Tax=Actibacterium lipolyticum TaxID=1524263 RepID=A0A238JW45_9RHOB|nr:threonine-phosphate decarboxylase CobD [Actibacterium lipolyticum]SMX34870.1 Histidinol-phosphate aminotransferase [Actibacterium lipolyticum]